ncbi:molybdopterin-binding oxidoreductase, partial [Streptomyces sp. ISL-44]|nr:molybdopterin-binding oxidoreductase [Streptomyces sp. ISL-44]
MTADRRRRQWLLGALSGVVAAAAGLAVGELAAAAVRPESSPVASVGAVVIDATPAALKEWAIRQFGTADKLVLTLGILAVLGALAVGAGVLALRHLPAGMAVAGGFGLLGAAAALGRPEAGWRDALPSLAAGLAAA